jgi:hypothetical protein
MIILEFISIRTHALELEFYAPSLFEDILSLSVYGYHSGTSPDINDRRKYLNGAVIFRGCILFVLILDHLGSPG